MNYYYFTLREKGVLSGKISFYVSKIIHNFSFFKWSLCFFKFPTLQKQRKKGDQKIIFSVISSKYPLPEIPLFLGIISVCPRLGVFCISLTMVCKPERASLISLLYNFHNGKVFPHSSFGKLTPSRLPVTFLNRSYITLG